MALNSSSVLSAANDLGVPKGTLYTLLCQRTRGKCGFIKEHANLFCINLLCDVLDMSRSGYYDGRSRSPNRREQTNKRLDEKIKEVYQQHKQRYGSPRITHELQSQSIACSHTHVERRMQSMGQKGFPLFSIAS